MEITKTCSKCGEVKAVELFRFERNSCRACCNEDGKKYRANNLEKATAYEKKYRSNNLEKVGAATKKWRANNPEKVAATREKWFANNREKVSATREKWLANNRETIVVNQKKWRSNNPEKVAANKKKLHKKSSVEISFSYVKKLIAGRLNLPACITPELIEVKRKHIQILRKIKELANAR